MNDDKPKLNFAALLKAQSQQSTSKYSSKRDLLYGTGLTKKSLRGTKHEDHTESHTTSPDATSPTPTPLVPDNVIPFAQQIREELHSALVDQNIQLDEWQQSAVENLMHQRFGVIIGPAGTGKTTTLKALVAAIRHVLPKVALRRVRYSADGGVAAIVADEETHESICFVAFTGRASQQMKRPLPPEYHPMVDTIHATLEYKPIFEDYFDTAANEWKTKRVFRPTRTAANPLPYKVGVVDEASMTPIPLWDEFLDAMPKDCRIYLIGDINQLPPVQGRSVLPFAMLKWPTFELKTIHRTAQDSPIVHNAWRILRGEFPQSDKTRFIIQRLPDEHDMALLGALSVVQKLRKAGQFQPMRDAFIVPQNVGMIGTEQFNRQMVQYFNPPQRADNTILNPRILIKCGFETRLFAIGDKVMLHKNVRELGLTNGMMGVVQAISINGNFRGDVTTSNLGKHIAHDDQDFADISFDNIHNDVVQSDIAAAQTMVDASKLDSEDERERQASHIVRVKFQDMEQPMDFSAAGMVNKLTHAYAFTCHKAQGAEFHTVVVLVHAANSVMLNREWLYTAVTRAQQRVILLYNPRGMGQALNTQRIVGDTLEQKAQAFIKLMDKSDTRQPILPEPETLEVA